MLNISSLLYFVLFITFSINFQMLQMASRISGPAPKNVLFFTTITFFFFFENMLFKQIQEYFKIRVFKKKNITYTLPFKRLRSERF